MVAKKQAKFRVSMVAVCTKMVVMPTIDGRGGVRSVEWYPSDRSIAPSATRITQPYRSADFASTPPTPFSHFSSTHSTVLATLSTGPSQIGAPRISPP